MKFQQLSLLILVAMTAACGDCTYSRPVEGCVTSVGSRFQRGAEGTGQEKIALELSPWRGDAKTKEVAAGADGLAVECVSTRCAALKEGSCVRLLCGWDRRFLEPDVIACKMEKTVARDSFAGQ